MIYRSPRTLAMVKVANKAAEQRYAPDILAHELGHAKFHGKSKLLMPARRIAPSMGSLMNVALATPLGLAGHLVPLVDEGMATRHAIKTMKKWDIPEEDQRAAKKRLGLGMASYAVGPTVDAGLTIAGLATGNPIMRVSAPVIGKVVGDIAGRRLIGEMDRIPIKGITREEALRLAAEDRPGLDVHFASRPLPDRGGFVNKPMFEPSERQLEDNRLRRELTSFIGREASGNLLRKGGVIIGPTE